MKSKKKFLLLGVGVMGALALGVGATSTFAWYVANTATSVSGAQAVVGNVTVTKDTTAVPANLPVTIHLVTDSNDTIVAPKLSTWDGTTLKIGNVDKYDVVTLVTATKSECYAIIPLYAWAESTATGTALETIRLSLAGSSATANFTLAFDSTYTVTGANEDVLQSSEVKFFYSANNTVANFTEAMETAEGHDTVPVSVSAVANSSANGGLKGSSAKVGVGYLCVRIEGSVRNTAATAHVATTTYKTKIAVTAPTAFTIS